MPAFAQKSGGLLTDKQIDVLVQGIRAWALSGADHIAGVPSYQPQQPGDPQRAAEVYRTYCSACHGADGRGGKGGSIVDSSYLALVSDHNLRMSVIVGHPSVGAPDWRGDVPGQPLSEQQVSDVVAWMASHRTAFPGQPYPSPKTDLGRGNQ
jgi:mono/diheme cytochrome c family protein